MMPHKSKVVACVAPHPDDETLGCGGTLLKHFEDGDAVHWIIATDINAEIGFTPQQVDIRALEIQKVSKAYSFAGIHQLHFPTMRLDQIPMLDIVSAMGQVIRNIGVEVLYVPYRNDAHSDHAVVFDAAIACARSFRYPSVKSIIAYETLSETEFGLKPEDAGFRPNLFVGVDNYIERKIDIMRLYAGEMAEFPFPRSEVTIRALAQLRGSQAGTSAAEAFMLLKEIR
jgi:LmbE family N-acetylglucosaminyl deacetylase